MKTIQVEIDDGVWKDLLYHLKIMAVLKDQITVTDQLAFRICRGIEQGVDSVRIVKVKDVLPGPT